jgi:hypothetical protein
MYSEEELKQTKAAAKDMQEHIETFLKLSVEPGSELEKLKTIADVGMIAMNMYLKELMDALVTEDSEIIDTARFRAILAAEESKEATRRFLDEYAKRKPTPIAVLLKDMIKDYFENFK